MGRKWWHKYFTDHPLYIKGQKKELRPPIVWANAARDKIHVFCTPCMQREIGLIMTEEEKRIQAGETLIPRSHDQIKLELFNFMGEGHKWIEVRSDTLLVHLRDCTLQPDTVRLDAKNELAAQAAQDANAPTRSNATPMDVETTPRAQRTYSGQPGQGDFAAGHVPIVSPQPIRFYSQPSVVNQWSQGIVHAPPTSTLDIHRSQSGIPWQGPSPIPPPDSFPLNRLATVSPTHTQFTYTSSSSGFGYSVSNPPGSRVGTPLESISHPFKQRRTASGKRTLSARASIQDMSMAWDENRQRSFEVSLARLTASAGLSLNWVSNPEFISFCSEFIPAAKVPSRKSLANRILPTVLRDICTSIRQRVQGNTVTVQCDGWTGQNNLHLIAFMLTTNRQVYTVQVNDTTVERKMADNLLKQMEEILAILKNEWGVIVIAFTTDASGESRKARRLLQQKYPNLVTPDCYCHQINLIVGDYFKTQDTTFLIYASQANDLITWLRSKTALIGLLKAARALSGKTPLSIIHPVPTRWTAFYLAYRRLLDIRETLELVIITDAQKPVHEQQVIPEKDRQAREKALKMVQIARDPIFWQALARIKHHLAPLAIAANLTQSSHCRLDEVLLTFGSLEMEYHKLTEPEDAPVREALLRSIEQRWAKADQDVFIAAVLLNPFLKTSPFQRNPRVVSIASINTLLTRLWLRFYSTPAPPELYNEIKEYLENREAYEDLNNTCLSMKAVAASKNETPDPVRAYVDMAVVGVEPTPLVRLALHILSICPNSASCERLFSTFGLILTKLRTRLGKQRVVDLAECKMHIHDEHMRNNTKQHLRKRAFGIGAEQAALAPATPTISTSALAANSLAMTTNSPTNNLPSDVPEETSGSTEPSTMRSLRTLTSKLIRMLDEDIDVSNPLEGTASPTSQKRRLDELFDFSADHWVGLSQRSAVGNLESELEFYDLLELDAGGDPDLDYDVDDCVASLLME